MSNVVFLAGALGRRSALAIVVCGAALTAGCSTDVQRFGYTGSLGSTASVNSAPVEPVQSAALRAPAPTYNTPSTYASRSPGTPRPLYNPSPAASTPPVQSGYVHVQQGDTVYSIARRNGLTVTELAAANGLQYPYSINVGQRLVVPGTGTAADLEPVRVASRGTGSGIHRVSPGDTLFSISQRYGVDVGELADANNLDDSATIRIGQTLTVPDGASASAQGGPLEVSERRYSEESRVLAPRRVARSNAEAEAEETRVASTSPLATQPLPNPPERAAAEFRWPVRGRIISQFGIATDGTRNDGINIAVPEGASVKAADNGVVAYAGDELKGYGNLILIRHANDWVTAYAHNSTLLVNRGDTVRRGQIIAKAGKSGSVDKPQLHFEVRRGAKAVNPMDYLDGA